MAPKKKAVKKAPSVGLQGKRYRMLRKGELIRETDQAWTYGTGPWKEYSSGLYTGEKFDPEVYYKTRREVVKRRGK